MEKKSRSDAWGIKNHLGGIWTPMTFASEREAKEYLWSKQTDVDGLQNHEVVRVRISLIPTLE